MPGLFDGTSLERPVTCLRCGQTHGRCACPRGSDGKVLDPQNQQVRIRREKRRGKIVTVIAGLSASDSSINPLVKALRTKFACGGSISDGEIELQGDHRDKAVELFKSFGYPAKPSGG